ncbi:MAG: alginate lyase family protein [Bdellovibrionaceae bacterium]|nr:alginate lyase family protein [Pseudobdellovibrionaceae bacterium]
MKQLFLLFAIGLLTLHCSTPKKTQPTKTAKEIIRVDSRGCMVGSTTTNPPALITSASSVSQVENYYEKLEFFFLLAAEKCLSNQRACLDFKNMMSHFSSRFLSSENNDSDISLAIKHSNNKLISIVAIHKYWFEKKYKTTLGSTPWLTTLLEKNDYTSETAPLTVTSEPKKYSSEAHNIAIASARAFVFVGVAEKKTDFIKKGLDQIPKVLATLRADGSLPLETRRGARALRYSMQVLSDIIAMIYIAQTEQPAALFKQYRAPLLKAAEFDLSALQNSSIIFPYAKENFSPGPIQNPELQDISSLRSRLAWILLLDQMEPGYLDKAEDYYIDKKSCSHEFLKNSMECSSLVQTIGDVLETPLGFTMGFNPKCAGTITSLDPTEKK